MAVCRFSPAPSTAVLPGTVGTGSVGVRGPLARCWVLRERAIVSSVTLKPSGFLCGPSGPGGSREASVAIGRLSPAVPPGLPGSGRGVVAGGPSVLRELHSGREHLCGQVTKGARWMPWHQEPMKDVGGCDMPRGAVNRAVIRGFPNGETRQDPKSCHPGLNT
jgi:hypothetical protein